MKLSNQQQKIYDYIRNHRGCTSHDITVDTFIQKPCARISELRALGVKITSIGHKKYPNSKAFEMYAIDEPLTKTVSRVQIIDGRAVEIKEMVNV